MNVAYWKSDRDRSATLEDFALSFRRHALRVVRFASLCVVLGAIQLAIVRVAYAKVVVLANRTTATVAFTILPTGQPARGLTLAPGDSRPVYFDHQLRIRFETRHRLRSNRNSHRRTNNHAGVRVADNADGRSGDGRSEDRSSNSQEHLLEASCAYFFGDSPNGTRVFEKIGLGGSGTNQAGHRQPDGDRRKFFPAGEEASTIPVKILVDDDEMTRRTVWESRLRKRVAKASQVLEAHCGIRLRVVAVDTWDSDDGQDDFFQSLSEFEREVFPKPGRLAIGFSSQYRLARGRVHMGGTRGALQSHILLKERSPNIRETERLELLVHELGHYLGASHSPEPESVMRPVLSGGLQRSVGSHIRFDPVNTLLIAMMGDEIRQHRVRKLADLSLSTKRRMRQIQTILAKALPDDPAAGHYVRLLGAATTGPLMTETGKILRHIVRVAKLKPKGEEERGKAEGGRRKAESVAASVPGLGILGTKTENPQAEGDRLTEYYVRQAALAAGQARREYAESAFLLALGIAMDDTGMLLKLPWTEPLVRRIEPDRQRHERIQVLGNLTMRGRRDWTRHFFVSALSVVLHGSRATRGAGIAKELFDAQGGSGFSFADMAANRAGIAFAVAVLNKNISLPDVGREFRVQAFLPPLDDLAEGLTASQLRRDYGGFGDPRFAAQLAQIDRRVIRLPIYGRLRRSRQEAGP